MTKLFLRLFLLYAVNIYIHLFIIEANSSSNGDTLGSRILIPPDIILVFLSIEYDAIIPRLSFIRTRCDRLRRFKEFKVDTCFWEVITDWKTCLVEQQR